MGDKREMICDRCKKSVPIPNVQYVAKGGDSLMALCSLCRSEIANERIKYPQIVVKKGTPQKEQTKKAPYFCERCRYKFLFDPSTIANLRCPYCGKSDRTHKYKPQSADTLLKTLTDEEYQYPRSK